MVSGSRSSKSASSRSSAVDEKVSSGMSLLVSSSIGATLVKLGVGAPSDLNRLSVLAGSQGRKLMVCSC